MSCIRNRRSRCHPDPQSLLNVIAPDRPFFFLFSFVFFDYTGRPVAAMILTVLRRSLLVTYSLLYSVAAPTSSPLSAADVFDSSAGYVLLTDGSLNWGVHSFAVLAPPLFIERLEITG